MELSLPKDYGNVFSFFFLRTGGLVYMLFCEISQTMLLPLPWSNCSPWLTLFLPLPPHRGKPSPDDDGWAHVEPLLCLPLSCSALVFLCHLCPDPQHRVAKSRCFSVDGGN